MSFKKFIPLFVSIFVFFLIMIGAKVFFTKDLQIFIVLGSFLLLFITNILIHIKKIISFCDSLDKEENKDSLDYKTYYDPFWTDNYNNIM